MHDAEDLKESVRNLSSGSTVGMVDSALKAKGVASGPRAEVLEFAKRIVNRRHRIKHGFVAATGMLAFTIGICGVCLLAQNGIVMVRIPGSVAIIGLLATIYGLYSMTQNRV